MKKGYWIILTVLILGLIAIWYWGGTEEVESSLVTEENAVLIEDQQPGEETTVAYAKLAQPGYVIVYVTDSSGNKSVLGSSDLLPAGEHRKVIVRHRRGSNSNNGTTVSAAIVADDGDEVFSEEDTEVVADDAVISVDVTSDTELTDEELVELLDEAGYDVLEEEMNVEEENMEEENSPSDVEEETPLDDEEMGNEAESEEGASTTIEEDSTM
jgi:hypothetical protein